MGIVTCAVLAAGILASDSTPKPADLLAKMRKAYDGIEAAQFTVEVSHPFYNYQAPMTVSIRKPSFARVDIQMKGGAKIRTVSDGKQMALSDLTKPAAKSPMTELNQFGGMPVNLESICFLNAGRELSTEKGNNMEKSVLSVQEKSDLYILKETVTQPDRIIFYEVDKKTFLIMKTTEFRNKEAKPYSNTKLKNLNLKPKFGPGFFDFP
ncbi:MAG: hypothetical protein KF784_06455 [Fimbriimonadaceae bacterium]|nr:hypothetical protein [Fimbriimonadaceae bacterium]